MSLAKKAAHGIAWVTFTTIITKIFDFSAQLALARLLDPADFGLIAIGLLAINTMTIFRDMGFGAALIYKKDDPDHIAANTAFILLPIFATILFIIVYLSASSIASFFGNLAVGPIIQILALTFVISSIGTVPSMLLEKELEFKKKVIPETLPRLGYAIVAVTFAFYGYGVWSLVYGQITSAILMIVLIWVVSDWRPTFTFDKKVAKELFDYGKHIMSASIVIFIITNIDDAIVGKVLGMDELGLYTIAYMISNLPATQITHLVGRVMFPTYSKLEGDEKSLKSAYLKTLNFVSMLSIPAAIGIFLIAPDFVSIALGEKWEDAIPAIQVLCFYGLSRSIAATTGSLFQATGMPEILFKTGIFQLLFMILLIPPLVAKFGIVGMSIAVFIPLLLITMLQIYIVGNILNLTINDVFKTFQFTVLNSILMSLWFKFADELLFLTLDEMPLLKLIMLILSSIIIYFGVIYIFNRNVYYQIKNNIF